MGTIRGCERISIKVREYADVFKGAMEEGAGGGVFDSVSLNNITEDVVAHVAQPLISRRADMCVVVCVYLCVLVCVCVLCCGGPL